MSETSDISVGDKLCQPSGLVLLHPVQISEFGDSFFTVYLRYGGVPGHAVQRLTSLLPAVPASERYY
jgi:hypothetical protein